MPRLLVNALLLISNRDSSSSAGDIGENEQERIDREKLHEYLIKALKYFSPLAVCIIDYI